jgi:hypothetical protein
MSSLNKKDSNLAEQKDRMSDYIARRKEDRKKVSNDAGN